MDIPIAPKPPGPLSVFPHAYQPIIFLTRLGKKKGKKEREIRPAYFTSVPPCPRQNNMDLCCLANNFNKKLLIGDWATCLWAHRPPDPSGFRSLMSSTAGFIGANLVNKGLARTLQALILIRPRQTVFSGSEKPICGEIAVFQQTEGELIQPLWLRLPAL